MTKYDLDFLKEKGFLETSIDMEDKYDTAEGDVKAVSYRFDSKNRLAYFDDFDKGDIASILKVLRERRNFDYYWFWKEGRIYAFRTFGENKQFIFNTQHSKKTEYVKSKKDKLSKFSSENSTALFEVKDVISLFYRRLWDLRLKLAKAIKGGFDDRNRILAAQRLLDRLIFTYFIAERGIIYCIDKRGRQQELSARNLFKYLIKVSGDFHSLLNVLFFDYLNDSKKNDMPVQGAEGYFLFIPYLNGGLFRERHITTPAGKSIGESELKIEGFDWKELIDALNEYNWIIDGYTDVEDEDTIGNLTPEILGHIYEKFVISVSELDDIDVSDLATTREGELKKGNKKIGAYYTPEVITKYIAENTIFPFAMDKLELDEKYENFIGFHEAHKDDADQLSQFNDALKDIKVLDPAVGSGAFLMAAADILFDWRRKCRETLDNYHLRREIIINNLHGVDIMEGAVEICMLRLWLWLIAAVDTGKEIEALPNIDFNIFEGNSLIGYVDEKEVVDLKPKKKPKARWDTLIHLQFTMDNWGEEGIWYLFQQRNDKIREYRNASGERAERLRSEIKQMTDEFNGLLDSKLLKELQNKKVEIDENRLVELKPFHWVMQFSDVFEKGGFDVVIGNPPYVRADTENSIFIRQRKIVGKIKDYETLFEKWDLFVAFVERSVKGLLNKKGKFSFIVSDAICTVKYSEKIRKWLAEEFYIPEINHFEGFQVFVGVGIVPVVFFIDKSRKPAKTNKILHSDSFDKITKKLVDQDSPSLFKKTEGDILESEYNKSKKLGDICYISYGLRPNADEKIAKGEFGKEDLISNIYTKIHSKKYIEGKDVKRYTIETIKYLEWGTERCPDGIARKTFPELYTGKKILRGTIVEGILDIAGLICNHSLIVFKRFVDLKGINNRSILTSIKKHNNLPRAKLEKISKNYSYEYLLAIMNSTFANRYLNAVRRHKLKNYFYPDDFRKLPIKTLKNQGVFVNLVNYLQFLYLHDSPMSDFFDCQLADSLVYELYFCEKFNEDNLYPEPKHYLLDIVSKHLEPIEYDRWAELHWKAELEGDLTAPEAQELAVLESANMQTIGDVYDALRSDADVGEWIERIRGHEWVRVVEGDSNA